MFGYVRPYKPELKIRDYESYRAVYCGLCHALGRNYSFFMRMILSYDLTFLAMLQLSLSAECPGFENRRCPVRLFHKRACCRQAGELTAAADIAVLLFYRKLRDDLADSGFKKKAAAAMLLPFAAFMHKKAASRSPQAAELIERYGKEQQAVENENRGIDAAAEPTAAMMQQLFKITLGARANERVSERLGYFLGRWIYFADAADDLEQDVKRHDYNPFVTAYQLDAGSDFKKARGRIELLMNSCVYEINAAGGLLEYKRFSPVIENILRLGLPQVTKDVIARKKLAPL